MGKSDVDEVNVLEKSDVDEDRWKIEDDKKLIFGFSSCDNATIRRRAFIFLTSLNKSDGSLMRIMFK